MNTLNDVNSVWKRFINLLKTEKVRFTIVDEGLLVDVRVIGTHAKLDRAFNRTMSVVQKCWTDSFI